MSASDVDGLNAGYAQALLEEYLGNPDGVPAEWRTLFENEADALVAEHPALQRLLDAATSGGNGTSPVDASAIPAAPAGPADGAAPTPDSRMLGGVAAAMALVKA